MTSIVLCAILLSAPPAAAAESSVEKAKPADLEAQVRELARQLHSDSLQERDTAEKKLIDLGPGVLEFLIPNPRMPDEMRQRVVRIRQQLETKRAETSAAGTPITLKVDKQPLSKVLKALQKQSGNRIVDRRREAVPDAADPLVSVDFKNATFWQVLDAVLDQANLAAEPMTTDENSKPLRAIAIKPLAVPRGARSAHAAYSGAFRFEPISVTARRGLADPAQSGVEVQVAAMWEPRLMPISMTFARGAVQAVVDGDKPLKSAVAGSEAMNARGNEPMRIQLELPAPGTRSINKIRGQIQALLPGHIETFRIGELSEGKRFHERRGNATLTIDRVHRNEDAWEVGLKVKFENPAGALQSHLLDWIEENEIWLEGPTGKKTEYGTYTSNREAEDEYGVTYLFPVKDDIKGYTLIYRTPIVLLEKTIDFELKNLELP